MPINEYSNYLYKIMEIDTKQGRQKYPGGCNKIHTWSWINVAPNSLFSF